MDKYNWLGEGIEHGKKNKIGTLVVIRKAKKSKQGKIVAYHFLFLHTQTS